MILVISKEKRGAAAVAEILRYMGLLAYPTTPKDALSEISTLYRAALIINPEGLPDIKDYLSRIHTYVLDIPVFAVSESDAVDDISHLFFKVYKRSFSPKIAVDMMTVLRDNNLNTLGTYRLAGIDASVYLDTARWFDIPLSLTYTESMILRFLIRTYPNPVSAEKIVKHAFNPRRAPESSCIRTHLSVMNKKFRELTSLNLTVSVPKGGYVLKTPELAQK